MRLLLLEGLQQGLCQLDAALAAFPMYLGECELCTTLTAEVLDELKLRLGIRRELIDGYHNRDTIALQVLDVLLEVHDALCECIEVFHGKLCLRHTAVVLQCAYGGNQYRCIRLEAGHLALDVEELLSTEIGTEAGLRHRDLTELQCEAGRLDGVAAMRDVRERAAMHEGHVVFEGLDDVRLDGILQQCSHGADRLQIRCGDRFPIDIVGHDDAGETLLEILHIVCEAEDCHDFGRHGDDEMILTYDAVGLSAESDHDVSELTIVHIDAALPVDGLQVDAKLVALLDMIIEECGEQVVCARDGMEVTGEMKVQILHGNYLSHTAACSTAFNSETRTE